MIFNALKSNGFNPLLYSPRVIIVSAKDKKATLDKIMELLPNGQVQGNAVVVQGQHIYITPETYRPMVAHAYQANNKGLENRVVLAQTIMEVIEKTAPVIDVQLSSSSPIMIKRTKVVKFDHLHADLLFSGQTNVPVSVSRRDGVYLHHVNHQGVQDDALAAIEYLISINRFPGSIGDNGNLTMRQPIAFQLDLTFARELIINPIRGGYYIVGDFTKPVFTYTSRQNLLKIRCSSVIRNTSDLTGSFKPFVVIAKGRGKLLDILSPESISVAPKMALTSGMTIA